MLRPLHVATRQASVPRRRNTRQPLLNVGSATTFSSSFSASAALFDLVNADLGKGHFALGRWEMSTAIQEVMLPYLGSRSGSTVVVKLLFSIVSTVRVVMVVGRMSRITYQD